MEADRTAARTADVKPFVMKFDEGCPIAAAIEDGDTWDGGTCPECGATCVAESCITWVPRV
jgi:hypothetical protein